MDACIVTSGTGNAFTKDTGNSQKYGWREAALLGLPNSGVQLPRARCTERPQKSTISRAKRSAAMPVPSPRPVAGVAIQ